MIAEFGVDTLLITWWDELVWVLEHWMSDVDMLEAIDDTVLLDVNMSWGGSEDWFEFIINIKRIKKLWKINQWINKTTITSSSCK